MKKINRIILALFLISALQPNMVFAEVKHKKKTVAHHVSKKRHVVHKKKPVKKHSVAAVEKRSPVISNEAILAKTEEPNLVNSFTARRRGFSSPFSSFSSVKQKLVSFVNQTVDSMSYSHYKLGGKKFDPSRGIYVLDCSDYVDNILMTATPSAYSSLVNWTGTEKPTSRDYYDFFSGLSAKNYHWDRVDEVEKLQPGDILVFRNKATRRSRAAGHVMIVMNKPSPIEGAYLVRVADSAPSGHSQDTRQGKSGIGIGTLLLKADADGQPAAYAWKVGARWKNNVHFAMARPGTGAS